ncbi:hypothetical protein AURDEDRAFT_170567 [Auricularia subglabra TFB-10046 SS5]|nr:hypothetical protein AURDEDRAFT_170567 [Auricularia subglabra TFB-10046 SS5]
MLSLGSFLAFTCLWALKISVTHRYRAALEAALNASPADIPYSTDWTPYPAEDVVFILSYSMANRPPESSI